MTVGGGKYAPLNEAEKILPKTLFNQYTKSESCVKMML